MAAKLSSFVCQINSGNWTLEEPGPGTHSGRGLLAAHLPCRAVDALACRACAAALKHGHHLLSRVLVLAAGDHIAAQHGGSRPPTPKVSLPILQQSLQRMCSASSMRLPPWFKHHLQLKYGLAPSFMRRRSQTADSPGTLARVSAADVRICCPAGATVPRGYQVAASQCSWEDHAAGQPPGGSSQGGRQVGMCLAGSPLMQQ